MNAKNTPTPKWQLALIPILVLVLAGVVWNNFAGNDLEDFSNLLTATNLKSSPATTNWKSGQQANALAFNPFRSLTLPKTDSSENRPTENRLPLATSESDTTITDPSATPASSIESLSSKPVTLLIRKGKKEIAVIGDQIIHSGQQLESGYHVDSIDLKRILLSNPEGQITLPIGETATQN
jgi:hypothetical protein